MKFIFCVINLGAIVSVFVQADREQELFDELRDNECNLKMELCRKQMVTKVTSEDILGLCNANPLTSTSSKCLMECQMRQYKWMNDNGFQQTKYLEYIKSTSLGYDNTYVNAAEKAANVCKDKKAPNKDSCETAYLILKCLQDEGDKQQKINLRIFIIMFGHFQALNPNFK